MSSEWTKLTVENFGPISHTEITIRPVTVIIGKNSFGKSLLINLAYLLSDTLPDFYQLRREVDQEVGRLVDQAYNAIKAEDTKELARALSEIFHVYFKKLGPAIGANLTNRFKEFFNVREVADLFRGHILVKNTPLSYFIKAEKDSLTVKFDGYEELEIYVKNIKQEHIETFFLDVEIRLVKSGKELRSFPYRVKEPADIHLLVGGHALPYALAYLYPLSFGAGKSFLLTDSRAGILRLARTAVATSLEYGRLLVPARESAFLAAYNRLAVRFREKGPSEELEELFKEFLAEIGLKNIEVRLIGGYPEIYVEDIWGKKLPLEECPSGVRESLSAALALVAEGVGSEVLFVEEIESHLHPKALDYLIRLAWEAVLKREESPIFLIMTTHNPIVLSKLNNLILKTGKGVHELVTVIHLREANGVVESEELKVSEKGFDESGLSEIFVELLEERGELV